MKVVNLRNSLTEKDRNIEKLLKWQSDTHVLGARYSAEYIREIRKAMKSPTGKSYWRRET